LLVRQRPIVWIGSTAVAAFLASVAAIVDTGWSGVAAFVVVIAVHVGLGLAVGRWWALCVPPAVWLIVIITSPHPSSSDLSGTDLEAATIVVCALVGDALVAVGIIVRRLFGRQWVHRSPSRSGVT
jgi:hypothetical protein